MTNEKVKARDVHPTVLRLHPDVRAQLVRLAFINGRSLSKEIAIRLECTLKDEAPAPSTTDAAGNTVYPTGHSPTVLHTANEKDLASTLSGADQAMLELFRRLPPEKQLALLSLFR